MVTDKVQRKIRVARPRGIIAEKPAENLAHFRIFKLVCDIIGIFQLLNIPAIQQQTEPAKVFSCAFILHGIGIRGTNRLWQFRKNTGQLLRMEQFIGHQALPARGDIRFPLEGAGKGFIELRSGFFRRNSKVKELCHRSRTRHDKRMLSCVCNQRTGMAMESELFKRPPEIAYKIIDIFKSEGEPHKIIPHTDVLAVFLRVIEE